MPGCRRRFVVCTWCDRGDRYCGDECAEAGRTASLRAGGARYQKTKQGREKHAARSQRYYARRGRQRRREQRDAARMTHQGYPPKEAGHGRMHSTPEIATQTVAEAVGESSVEEEVHARGEAPVAIVATGRLLWRWLATAVARVGKEEATGDAGKLRCMRCGRAGLLLRAEEADDDDGEGNAGHDSS